ncbi:MAG TPA: hypothetical protein VM285_01225 [Polyangia bacterium]|nr:hypothetical protein [Polyangia bacterium]
MPDTEGIRTAGDVAHLMRGARNAVKTCLSVTENDEVTIVCDEASRTVAAALRLAVLEGKARCNCFILERHIPRPADRLPPLIRRALTRSTVSIYTCRPIDGETGHRLELISLVEPHRLRHAHMINVTDDAMQQGMLSDYRHVARLNDLMVERLGRAATIRVTSRRGTAVTVVLDRAEPWERSAGVIAPGQWHNLPNGEIYTCPGSVDGVFICDGVVPITLQLDRFEIGRHPLRLEFRAGRLIDAAGGPGDLARHVLANVREGRNLDRIGMFAVGTNFDLLMPIGNATQDLFVPGAYFSLGRSPATGGHPASWSSSAQYPFTARKTSLLLDGVAVIHEGRYDPVLLAEAAPPRTYPPASPA